jgi:hypothetical protein
VLPLLSEASSPISLGAVLFVFGSALGSLDVSMNLQAVDVERASEEPLMSGFHALFSIGGFLGSGVMTALLSERIALSMSTILSSVILCCSSHSLFRACFQIERRVRNLFLRSLRALSLSYLCWQQFRFWWKVPSSTGAPYCSLASASSLSSARRVGLHARLYSDDFQSASHCQPPNTRCLIENGQQESSDQRSA